MALESNIEDSQKVDGGRALKPKLITDRAMMLAELENAEPWPGMPEGTRAIVNRRMLHRPDYEELKCIGYLRVGQVAHPVDMVYDEKGNPLGLLIKAGDFIDRYSQWQKILSQAQRADTPGQHKTETTA